MPRSVSSWSIVYRLGLLSDPFIPVNYDRSLRTSLESLTLGPSQRLLDVGSGNGRLLHHARRWLAAGGRVVGVELTENGVALGRYRAARLGVGDRVAFVQGDMRELSKLAASRAPFDGCLAHHSISKLASDAARRDVVRQVFELLRPGARFAFVDASETWEVDAIIAEARRVEAERDDIGPVAKRLRAHVAYRLTARAMRSLGIKEEAHQYTEGEMARHLADAGFTGVEIERTYGGSAYRAVAARAA